MLMQTVTYTDYNDVQQTESLYFNLTRVELSDLLPLLPRMEAWQNAANAGGDRKLTTEEIQEMISILKLLIERSYGIRSQDGRHFRKSPEIYLDFSQSAVYDAFFMNLFEDMDNANKFMVGIMPKELLNQAVAAAEAGQTNLSKETITELGKSVGGELSAVQEEVPAWIRENREPTHEELLNMSTSQLQDVFKRRMAKQ